MTAVLVPLPTPLYKWWQPCDWQPTTNAAPAVCRAQTGVVQNMQFYTAAAQFLTFQCPHSLRGGGAAGLPCASARASRQTHAQNKHTHNTHTRAAALQGAKHTQRGNGPGEREAHCVLPTSYRQVNRDNNLAAKKLTRGGI